VDVLARPIYEFRPLPDFFSGPFLRYANGEWIQDDGEYDLAFVSTGYGAPICLYVAHGYRQNIVSSWIDGSWTNFEPRHPRGNPWHHALCEGESEWGEGWDRDRHINGRVGREGMDYLCKKHRCANGRHVELVRANDPHVARGLVRDRDTKEVFKHPAGRCMYCGDSNAAALARVQGGAA
jgi:hypothetical protein